jgi:hypothetical protein
VGKAREGTRSGLTEPELLSSVDRPTNSIC